MTGPDLLRDRLRNETQAAHDALDRTLDLLGEPLGLLQYRRLLGRFHGFHRAVEPALAAVLDPVLLEGRGKLPALEHDLRVCGMESGDMAALPVVALPPLDDRGAALGAFYVAEGSTLGGRLISRHLRGSPAVPEEAHRYFNVYGERTGERWRATCAALDGHGDDDRAIRAANAVFGALLGWVSPSTWRGCGARMVGATGIEPVTPTMSR